MRKNTIIWGACQAVFVPSRSNCEFNAARSHRAFEVCSIVERAKGVQLSMFAAVFRRVLFVLRASCATLSRFLQKPLQLACIISFNVIIYQGTKQKGGHLLCRKFAVSAEKVV